MGRPEDLFALLENEGGAFVYSLIADRASEELFLDFKRSANAGDGASLHDRDRTNLRKAIGGFANSEGGVIIWGVECDKDEQKGDTARAIQTLHEPQRFASWLEGAVSGCTVPPVVGVRSIVIPIDDNRAVVATYVPRSTHAPHQMVGEGKYMIRAGSDFCPAPHGVVAGLFGRYPQPVLLPSFVVGDVNVNDKGMISASLSLYLLNDGQVTAEDLFVSLQPPLDTSNVSVSFFDSRRDWHSTSGIRRNSSIISPRDIRLAPRGEIWVTKIDLQVYSRAQSDYRWTLTAGCKGSIPETRAMHVTADALRELRVDLAEGRKTQREIGQGLFGLLSV